MMPVAQRGGVHAWRAGTFGPASEEPYRRRTSDRVRLVTAIVLVVYLALRYAEPSGTNQSLFTLVNGLPDELAPVFEALYWIGTLWAVVIVAVAAAVARRWRLARDLTLAGIVAALLARAIGEYVVVGESFSKVFDATRRLGVAPSFPLVRLAIVTAIVSAASPYVTVPTRRVGRVVVVTLAISAMYLGIGYPSDVLAGLVLGWGVAALVHLVFGSPGGRPTTPQVVAALDALGVRAHDVRLDPRQPAGATRFLGADDRGPITVRVLGRDETDGQLLSKVWRHLVYKDSGPHLYLTREQEVEHQAYVGLVAERAGVAVPEVLVAGTAGPGAALLVVRDVGGPALSDLASDSVSDALLGELWSQAGRLHDARVVHGDLNTSFVRVVEGRPVLTGFLHASSGADPRGRPPTGPTCSRRRPSSWATSAGSRRWSGRSAPTRWPI